MIDLTDKTNINPADADFPFGSVRDKTPSLGGTKYDKNTMSDYIQFFHKMMSESGVVPNGQLDNETNGWQLYEAFRKLTRTYRMYQATITQDSTNAPVAVVHFNDLGFTPTWSRSNTGYYKLTSTNNFTDVKTVVRPISVPGSTPYNFNFYKSSGQDDEIVLFTFNDSGSLSDSLIGQPCLVEVLIFD